MPNDAVFIAGYVKFNYVGEEFEADMFGFRERKDAVDHIEKMVRDDADKIPNSSWKLEDGIYELNGDGHLIYYYVREVAVR